MNDENETMIDNLLCESDVLKYDPFSGDFGSPGDKTLSNKMVNCRKETKCHICGFATQRGTRIRVLTEKIDGGIHSYRFCHECCHAMAKSWYDSGMELETRWNLIGKE